MKLTPDLNHYIPGGKDEFCADADGKKQRERILNRQSWNSLFFGVHQVTMFMAGILTSVGVMMLGTGVKSLSDKAIPVTLQALQSSTELGTIGFSVLAAAAAVTGISVLAHQFSSRVFHAATFDQMEINAQHVAKYLGKELQKEGPIQAQPVIIVQPAQERGDGRTWQDVVTSQRANDNLKRGV